MKLEVKHLVPYLPYELKFGIGNQKYYEFVLSGIDFYTRTDIQIRTRGNRIYNISDIKFKPLLRPLSDLTNEIEIDGEKFIPMMKLIKIAIDEYDRGDGYFNSSMVVDIEYTTNHARACFINNTACALTFDREQIKFIFVSPQGLMFSCGYVLMQMLFEWHFDVFGLIDQGLALPLI